MRWVRTFGAALHRIDPAALAAALVGVLVLLAFEALGLTFGPGFHERSFLSGLVVGMLAFAAMLGTTTLARRADAAAADGRRAREVGDEVHRMNRERHAAELERTRLDSRWLRQRIRNEGRGF